MMHADFSFVQKIIYNLCGLICSNVEMLPESKEYGACKFTMNQKQIQFRVAKITPTKIGQFVVFWKRLPEGPIAPYDVSDAVDYFVVSVRAQHYFGLFVFPKSALLEQGYVSKNGIGGKRAMRVYPLWDKPVNKQATQTQKWQLKYFTMIDESNVDVKKIKNLFIAS